MSIHYIDNREGRKSSMMFWLEGLKMARLVIMGAACIASSGANALNGTAVSMTMYQIIPDFETYPDTGRSLRYTTAEIGLAGHWIKHLLHFGFMYKAKV